MGIFIHPRLILLLGLLACSATGYGQTDSLPDLKSDPAATQSVPLLFTRTVNTNPAQEAPSFNTSQHIMPLEVIVNGAKSGTWVLLDRDGILYAPYDAFEEWRVQLPPDAKPIDFKLYEQTYWPLSAVPGYKFKLDYASQSVDLMFSPEAFLATRLTQEVSKRPVISSVLPSLFFNYDSNYSTTVQRNAPTVKEWGLLTEMGASNSWGVLTSSQVGRNLTNDPASAYTPSWVRLETTFTKDFPDENRTLRLGDAATRSGMWGRNVYYGGIQYGSNFALTPGFVSQPIPTLPGISTAPSTVEMYVNDVLRQVSSVPAGPFAIDNFPLMTGSGDVRMVVRDILGRETVIEQSFFISPQLLAKGLDDWSLEAGSLRSGMGVESNNYGAGFASGTWRHGYRNYLTLEGRAELTPQFKTLGLGVVSTLKNQILGSASIALSSGNNNNGGLWLLGLDHQKLHTSTSFQIQGASPKFHQLGQQDNFSPIKLQLAGNWSYTTETAGSFGLGIAVLNRYDNTKLTTLSGNYFARIGERNNLNFTASRAINGTSGTSVGVYFVMPLDNNRIFSASATGHGDQQDFYVTASQSPIQGKDLGWRGLAGRQQNQSHIEGGVYYIGRYGGFTGDASSTPDQTALRLGVNGGLVFADRKLFATQKVDQSFAVADVAGYEDVGIGLGGNMLSRTDKDGAALIPRLMPYQNNPIRLDPSELPVSAEINSIELNAVPAWRSAVKVVFPVRTGRGALLKITFEDGEDAPAGAILHIAGDTEEFYVARRGAAFVTGLKPTNQVILNWNGQQCKIIVTLPPETSDEIARPDSLTCKGVTR